MGAAPHQPRLRLGLPLACDPQEAYLSLANKTLMFLRDAALRYDAQYIVKIDDDVYFRLDRLPHAIKQWKDIHAGGLDAFLAGAPSLRASLRGLCVPAHISSPLGKVSLGKVLQGLYAGGLAYLAASARPHLLPCLCKLVRSTHAGTGAAWAAGPLRKDHSVAAGGWFTAGDMPGSHMLGD